MTPIRDLLNKIKWDKNEDPEAYKIVYIDRVLQQEVKIRFKDIKGIEGSFMVVDEAYIPLHTIAKVFKNDKLMWERKVKCFKVIKKEEKIKEKLKDKLGWVVGV